MEKIMEALNKNVDMHAEDILAEFRAQIQSNLDNLQRLVSELERPEYREFIRFAVAWQKLDHELSALRCKIRERLAEKPISPVDEFLKRLRRK